MGPVTTAEKSAPTAILKPGPFRVMVVDDSAIIRGFLSRYLSEDPDIEVVSTASNGAVALRRLSQYEIEVVVLDIEMPEMDGMTALPQMLKAYPDLMVVMASTLTRKNAEISLAALNLGAVDYVPKPESARSVNASIDFRRELVDKVKAWAGRRRRKRGEALPPTAPQNDRRSSARQSARSGGFVEARRPAARIEHSRPERAASSAAAAAPATDSRNIQLAPERSHGSPAVIAIGASTGGPQALGSFFKAFETPPRVPILVTQHMPATFTAILAGHLAQATGWPVSEATSGAALAAGHVYVAPGGKHLEVRSAAGEPVIRLTDDPPENFCKPAVDPMLRSVAQVYGGRALAVILTGMGHDGLKGARDLVRAGGTLLAQDEATSVVWGMPGSVAMAGLCHAVLPLEILARTVYRRQEEKR